MRGETAYEQGIKRETGKSERLNPLAQAAARWFCKSQPHQGAPQAF